ncbi:MAG: hypothetical protein IRY99_27695 [Isosphaeraceae bacterium]|nr:hypothetical protein [Isosphaeraceae bacterium]
MHRVAWMRLALFGLALAAPTITWAGPPDANGCPTCQASGLGRLFRKRSGPPCATCLAEAQAQGVVPPPMAAPLPSAALPAAMGPGMATPPGTGAMPPASAMGNVPPPLGSPPGRRMHLCPSCLAKAQAMQGKTMVVLEGGGPSPTSGACLACQGGMGAAPAPGMAPGLASVGGSAPGYASVGSPVPSAEPAPIGVMQAGYRPDGGMDPWGSPGRASVGGRGASGRPEALPPAAAPYLPERSRTSLLSHLFPFRTLHTLRYMREEQARQQHAAIRYDNPDLNATSLPAAMVYGR